MQFSRNKLRVLRPLDLRRKQSKASTKISRSVAFEAALVASVGTDRIRRPTKLSPDQARAKSH